MKKLFILSMMLVTVFSLSAQKKKQQTDLDEKDGVFYLKSDGKKYTGIAYTYHDSGKKKEEFTYKKGKVAHEILYYDKTGDIEREVNYKKGKRHGAFNAYYQGKKTRTVGEYKKGDKKGEWIWYNEDGSVKQTKEY